MGAFSIWHWLILLVVVVLVFGTGKLRNLGKDLGGAVKGFKEGLHEAGIGEAGAEKTSHLTDNDNTINGQVAQEASDTKTH